MARSADLARLDLKVRNRIGTGAIREHQVAVDLVGIGTDRLRTNQHISDPDRVRVLALKCALVDHVTSAVGLVVIDEETVLKVLAASAKECAEEFRRSARAVVVDGRDEGEQVAPERRDDLSQVASRPTWLWILPRWTASRSQSWITTSLSCDRAPTSTSMFSACCPVPWWLITTVADESCSIVTRSFWYEVDVPGDRDRHWILQGPSSAGS